MENLVQIARSKIVQYRINLLSKECLIEWADSVILKMAKPPNYILDMAIGEIPVHPEKLDTIRFPINSKDCIDIIEILKAHPCENKADINQFESICYQLALITDGDLSEKLHWISDEIHLCNEDVKYFSSSLPQIEKALNEITTKIA